MTRSTKIFVDGEEGTTGLEISDRLKRLPNIELLQIESTLRKDPKARKVLLNNADIAILCLPDNAAEEAVSLIDNPNTKIIDASTRHRVSDGWIYGFPEYKKGHEETIRTSHFISNPGCYAIGAVAILYPLIEMKILPSDWPIAISGLSGYSGGGKSLIKRFGDGSANLNAYDYALNLEHKHLPEITKWGNLDSPPNFLPCVGNFYRGMLVRVPIPLKAIPSRPSKKDLLECYKKHYENRNHIEIVEIEEGSTEKEINPESLNGTSALKIYLLSDSKQNNASVIAQLDNLGKGASGQVVETIKILTA